MAFMAANKNEYCKSTESSSIDDSFTSSCSLSSSLTDLSDDASSSSSNGPLFELSELMAQLPIKRGLSKFYHGKSQTFGSLTNVKSVEELAKKESSYSQRMKACKSYRRNLNRHGPKATLTKRSKTRTLFSTPLGAKDLIVVD